MNDYDETPEPAALYLQLQRQKAAERNFVTPAPLAHKGESTVSNQFHMLEQQFLANQPLTFAELMALYAWSSAEWDAADRAQDYVSRERFSKLSLAVRPACVRAEKHGTSFLDDRTR